MFRVLERFLWLLHGDKSFFSDNDLDSRDQKESYCSNLRGILFAYRNHPTFMTTVWLETFLFFPFVQVTWECSAYNLLPFYSWESFHVPY